MKKRNKNYPKFSIKWLDRLPIFKRKRWYNTPKLTGELDTKIYIKVDEKNWKRLIYLVGTGYEEFKIVPVRQNKNKS